MKVLKVIGIIFLIIIVVFAILIFILSKRLSAPTDYETSIETGGLLEGKFLAHGDFDVSYYEQAVDEDFEKYEVYYPSELENDKYPVIVMANGSGVRGSKYKTVFEHYASWGFIVVGNEDDTSWSGSSSNMSLQYIIDENNDPSSVLYNKVDLDNIGIVGHSQGGVGVINAITNQSNKDMYKTAVALSPTSEIVAHKINWPYDISKVDIPLLMLAGTEGTFETESVIPLDHLINMYDKVQSDKVMARRIGNDHSQMLYAADGYVTAWFMYQLQDDEEAAKVFIGDDPEVANNLMYSDLNIDIK